MIGDQTQATTERHPAQRGGRTTRETKGEKKREEIEGKIDREKTKLLTAIEGKRSAIIYRQRVNTHAEPSA